jgi:RimJ/RimL family protein N-acetyltransferase
MTARDRTLFGRFATRAFQPDDVEVVAGWLDHPDTQSVIEDEQLTPRQRRDSLHSLAGATAEHDGECGFILERLGEPCGFIHLMWINWISRTGEIDFLVSPAWTRSLAGFAVIQQAGEIAFDRLNLNKVYGFVYANNAASLSPLRRVLTIEATMHQATVRGGQVTDVHIASMTALQYQLRKQEIAWHEHER